ncbi:glycosyltransferase [Roseofilum casamattae]|uniref:Glycosyltransferase n=1 Tax=Roseofilum casamattae BLCC-M143 TaxID=3022442 RepID=A0ABT7C3P8_9CYAN|nr:glycosyltransferase [Roseofilum casamattae]MDJ1185782.1 glycosyltransferase [Roseofilum casamattae BLCC-M143]
MDEIILGLASISAIAWIALLGFWGQFWRGTPQMETLTHQSLNLAPENYPKVCVIIPARNEAEVLPRTLRSLVDRDYPGSTTILAIDDGSTDDTAAIAKSFVGVTVIAGEPLPSGWTGKLWAMEQGVRYSQTQQLLPDYYLFTDADIQHPVSNITQLVQKAEAEDLELVSLMVKLNCTSFWERLLIPAFIFFFQKLYPFPWVNNPQKAIAAAAGGCILIRRAALDRIGGLDGLRHALIDDCTLAQAVKSTGAGRIWLGLSQSTISLRSYTTLQPIWDMVARTAFTQLNYSPLLLLGTLLGMILVYLMPPLSIAWGSLRGEPAIAIVGALTWGLMAIAYAPTARLYDRSPFAGLQLPSIATLYTLMTVDSALRHWQGRGGAWKGRVYPKVEEK